jgi:hypothetical protein
VLPSPVSGAPPRAGGEFLVNSYTTGTQFYGAVATNATGRFVVVWQSAGQDGSNYGIFGQRFDAEGTPLGDEFAVNTYTTDRQGGPAVALDGAGNFVVVWTSVPGQDGSNQGVFGRRYDASGAAVGDEFLVNEYTTFGQFSASVGFDSAGNFVVVWATEGSGRGIRARRFDANLLAGSELAVSTQTTLVKAAPALAMNPDGSFVVTWSSYGQDGSRWGVFGRRFDDTGDPLGGEFAVNTHTTLDQDRSDVAAVGGGAFVVVWHSTGQDGSAYGIVGRRYDALGNPLGGEFAVNAHTTSFQFSPRVAADGAGGFLVVWESDGQDGSGSGVFARSFDASGVPLDVVDFQVNSFITSHQRSPAIAGDDRGRFVVAWSDVIQDGNSHGMVGQRFGDLIFADGFD